MSSNLWADVESVAQSVQHDAYFIVREAATMPGLVKVFTEMSGGNTRKSYKYNSATAKSIGEGDDLTSSSFTPEADQTLTPAEIGEQFFITDLRIESEAPESIQTDAAMELGFAATDKLETDLLGNFEDLTGGTIGTAGTIITWGYVSAAIHVARNASKNVNVPLAMVLHGYQAAVLAKSASIAGGSLAQAPGYTQGVTTSGLKQVFNFMGVPIYQVFATPDTADDFRGGVFPKQAIALDWRRQIRVEPERDASRRGYELNMSAVYAHGVWRPKLGVQFIFDASAPTS